MTIEAIADKAGISPRAVRYYVQTGIIDAPFGRGRGARYGEVHLRQIDRAKAMKDIGYTLDHIAAARNANVVPACEQSEPALAAEVLTPANGVRVSISAEAMNTAGCPDMTRLDAALRKTFAKFGF